MDFPNILWAWTRPDSQVGVMIEVLHERPCSGEGVFSTSPETDLHPKNLKIK